MGKREIEQRKYLELFGTKPKDEPEIYHQFDPKYGSGTHGNGVHIFTLKMFKPESILDVGCGKDNAFCKLVRDEYKENTTIEHIKLVGMDFAAKPKKLKDIDFKQGWAHELPFKSNSFDVVTTFDMLEHILPEDVDNVLNEIFRVAKKGICVSISYRQVKSGLHRTIQPKEWWIEKLSKYGKVGQYLKYIYVNKND